MKRRRLRRRCAIACSANETQSATPSTATSRSRLAFCSVFVATRASPPRRSREVWRLYRPGQEIDKKPSLGYLAIHHIAVACVADREGKKDAFQEHAKIAERYVELGEQDMNFGSQLRERATKGTLDSLIGRLDAGGWSFCLSRPGYMGMADWMFTAKRLDRGKPSELNLAFLRRVLKEAGGPSTEAPEEAIIGTLMWRWLEPESEVE